MHIVMHSDNSWKSAITTLPKQTTTTGLQQVLSIGEELGLLPGPASDAFGVQDFCTSVTLFAEAASLDAELKASIVQSKTGRSSTTVSTLMNGVAGKCRGRTS